MEETKPTIRRAGAGEREEEEWVMVERLCLSGEVCEKHTCYMGSQRSCLREELVGQLDRADQRAGELPSGGHETEYLRVYGARRCGFLIVLGDARTPKHAPSGTSVPALC